MLRFYRKSISILFCLLAFIGLVALFCFNNVFVSHPLLPKQVSKIPWHLDATTDIEKGGSSTVVIRSEESAIDYDYVLTKDVEYPHVTVHLAFAELQNAQAFVDLSEYSHLSFKAKCSPRNLLFVRFHTFDPEVTRPDHLPSYRLAQDSLSCEDSFKTVKIDMRYLDVPEWWLWLHQIEISDQRYWLDKTLAISFLTSDPGPVNVTANVQLSDLELHRYNWRYAWLFAGVSVLALLVYFMWLIKFYVSVLVESAREKLRKDLPLMAYQKLTVEPNIDGDESRILRYLATEYANPELSLETAATALGIPRATINDVLKAVLGLNFSGYLNKIRLTEASRLLSETEDANVSEIAHVVGYNNVSYFNKLFKNEYGCTPKTFKNAFKPQNQS